MNCEKCKKIKATYHLTSIDNGQKREAHLCEGCARDTGMGMNLNSSIGSLLGTPPAKKPGRLSDSKCPTCGMTVEKIREKMRVGCANDYELFREELEPLLKKIHGAATHIGKTPEDVDSEIRKTLEKTKEEAKKARFNTDLSKLRKDLDEVVKAEKYEDAAKIRDQIRQLEKEKTDPDPQKPV